MLGKNCQKNRSTSEVSQIECAKQFVKDAVEKHGYTYSLDFSGITGEIKELQKDIEKETKFEKNTEKEVLTIAHSGYYEIINPPEQHSNFIKLSDFQHLSNDSKATTLYYYYSSYSNMQSRHNYNIRKGNSEFSMFINDHEYRLKTTKQGERKLITKKPHHSVEETWDNLVDNLFALTSRMNKQIEEYRSNDLKHLRTNLFVDPELANAVESHITDTLKKIEKIDVTIKEIQAGYKKLEDEEVIQK